MEHQIADPQNAPATCQSGLEPTGRCAPTRPENAPPPPEGYDPIAEIKRQQRWEQVFDTDGSLWDVREARATKHGFDLLFGFPANSHLPYMGGPPRLIATPALVAYWERNRFNDGATYDLPAGRTTMKRVRSRLRFNFQRDRRKFWEDRKSDLKTLPTREFAQRYHVTKEMTNQWRMQLLGPAGRPPNWWHHPEALAVLRNKKLKHREVAAALDISTSHSNRLRKLAQAFDQQQKPAPAGPIAKVRLPRKPTVPPVRRENPFRHHQKQGRMFVGSPFWRRYTPAQSPSQRIGPCHPFSQATAQRTGQLLLFHPLRGRESKQPILFQVQAFNGTFYDVYETRPTTHGFDLMFGYPTRAYRRICAAYNKTGLIPTPELVAHWETHRFDRQVTFDLPAGLTTMNRLRKKIGFNMKRDKRLAKLAP